MKDLLRFAASCKQVIEYSLKLDSNPEFTASVLVAYARAAFRLNRKGKHGALSVLDIAPPRTAIAEEPRAVAQGTAVSVKSMPV